MTQETKREPWHALLKSYPQSERINAVSIGAETLFIRLIAQADDHGNYYGEPRRILAYLYGHRWAKGEVTETDVERWRDELVTKALVTVYKVDEWEYLHVVNPHRRLRNDVQLDIRFPIPANIEEEACSEYVTTTGRKRNDNGTLEKKRKEKNQKRKEEDYTSVDQVIDYLNEKTKSSFRHSQSSRENIHARLNGDGLTVEECKLLIDYKTAEWLDDPKTSGWLNPTTLFRPSHYEKNLNAARRWDANGRPPLGDEEERKRKEAREHYKRVLAQGRPEDGE